ncbi:unnamed protein product [Caretta caretta]
MESNQDVCLVNCCPQMKGLNLSSGTQHPLKPKTPQSSWPLEGTVPLAGIFLCLPTPLPPRRPPLPGLSGSTRHMVTCWLCERVAGPQADQGKADLPSSKGQGLIPASCGRWENLWFDTGTPGSVCSRVSLPTGRAACLAFGLLVPFAAAWTREGDSQAPRALLRPAMPEEQEPAAPRQDTATLLGGRGELPARECTGASSSRRP